MVPIVHLLNVLLKCSEDVKEETFVTALGEKWAKYREAFLVVESRRDRLRITVLDSEPHTIHFERVQEV